VNSFGGIICLAEDQAEFFRSACQTPVHLIRHGVRHDFFRPPVEFTERKGNRLLFVGQWLRDFETLANAMLLIWSSNPNIKLDCVVPRFARDSVHLRQLAMDKRVSWHSDLPDVKLRRLYQEADLLFLPVLDAVANNAVLEALASGLPVVSTQVGGMVNYLPTCAGLLCKSRDSQSHAEAVCELMNSPSARIEAGNCARRFAVQHHDWGRIGRQLLDFIVIQSHTVCPDLNDQGRRRAGVN
jgi:glycosyltransferase involved in cell wall biosynthesis